MPKERNDDRRPDEKLADVLQSLACAISEWSEQARADNQTKAILERMDQMEKKLMASQSELAADLKLVLAQQQKTAAEIAEVQSAQTVALAKIVALEEVIAAGLAPTQELVDAVAAVKAQAELVDSLIPDLPVTPA